MKRALVLIAIASCAKGGALGSDALFGEPDALHADAPAIDSPIDSPLIDGSFDARVDGPPDARPDARPDAPPDARPDAPVDARPDAPPDACVPIQTELLLNPAFDLPTVGNHWHQVPIDPGYPIVTSDGIAPQSSPYKAWLGGWTGEDKGVATVTDFLWQQVTVPANTTQLVLTGYYVVGTNEAPGSTVYDTGTVTLQQPNGTAIEGVLALDNTATQTVWTPFTHTFTANVAGQLVRLSLTSTNDDTFATNFFFDTLSLKATHCP